VALNVTKSLASAACDPVGTTKLVFNGVKGIVGGVTGTIGVLSEVFKGDANVNQPPMPSQVKK